MTQLVFVPVTRDEAVALRDDGDLGVRAACAATPDLARAVGADAVAEEVEYAALSYAGELARTLNGTGPALVLAADVETSQITDQHSDRGEVRVRNLRWPQVQSLFADDPAAGPDADGDDDLLWFGVEELDQL